LWDSADARGVAEHLQAQGGATRVRAVFFNPRRFTLATGIPAMGAFEGDDGAWSQELRAQRITHVVLGDLGVGPKGDRSLRAFVAGHPAAFEREYANASFEVLRLDSEHLPTP
jgi:hypothetical protein